MTTPTRVHPTTTRARRLAAGIAGLLLAAALAACQPGSATAVPVATQVAQRLTQTASVPSATAPSATPTVFVPSETPSPTSTPTASATPTDDSTPTITPTPTETGTATRAPRATVAMAVLAPSGFGGPPHFYFGSPGGGFIASSYRYGSVGVGQRFSPHHGVDYSTPAGAPLVAVASGVIYYAGSDLERMFGPRTDFYGNVVVLQLFDTWNGRNLYALYGHLDQVLVVDGQTVAAGETLGTVGATGVALGAHAHLEVRLDNPDSYWATRNPELWLSPAPGTGALAIRVTNSFGYYLPGVRVEFTCADGAARTVETYWYTGVNPDDVYGENAAVTNIPTGFCSFRADIAGQEVTLSGVQVPAGGVGFAHLRLP